jgi:hypothetical protein
MKPAKPVRCACGKVVLAREAACGGFFVGCRRNDWLCWSAPVRKTRHDAIAAWNRTMRVHEIQRAARKYLREKAAERKGFVAATKREIKRQFLLHGTVATKSAKHYFAKRVYVPKAEIGK